MQCSFLVLVSPYITMKLEDRGFEVEDKHEVNVLHFLSK